MHSDWLLILQEAFESKQASMFVALDKLFALHNAMLLESRLIKAFFVYSMSIFIIYMFTSTKQTYPVRPRLYIGMSTDFAFFILGIKCESLNKFLCDGVKFLFIRRTMCYILDRSCCSSLHNK